MSPYKNYKKPYEKKYCEICGAEIPKPKGICLAVYNKRRFCSAKCRGEWLKKRALVDVKCDFCGKIFQRHKKDIHTRNFCSRECYMLYRHKKHTKELKCEYCGKTIVKTLTELKEGKHHFCSWECWKNWKMNKNKEKA